MKWGNVPEFRGWLKSVTGEPEKAYCSVCKRNLKAKRSVIILHALSEGHAETVSRLKDPHNQTLDQLPGF